MDDDITKTLSSTAKFKVLQCLVNSQVELPLRHIELLTGLAVRSVQVALAGLCEDKTVIKRRHGNLLYHRLNLEHSQATLLLKIFALIRQEQLEKRSAIYSWRAKESLQFSDDLFGLLESGKKV